MDKRLNLVMSLQGLFGFREVKVNPERAINFKVADYQRGVRESRSIIY